MTRALRAGAVLAATWLLACGAPQDAGERPKPFALRVSCAISRWLERGDLRIPEDRVFDPCADDPLRTGEAEERVREMVEQIGSARESETEGDEAPEEVDVGKGDD